MTHDARPPRGRLIAWGLSALVAAVFAAANAHLVAVSLASQPACVDHEMAADGKAAPYRAAQPSC
jgi:hypothetical protein